ncbi:hypothetical protein FIBSPDRAFT_435706 [Athelia psychrophila]|uniref:Uncharacterized protein n=1 Tax=Athelia psychrophila TaxID=1759441 RepID=A0A166VNN6_9AGAM|nr:hypothetical protein FIBSPDRAFT_435706 [Fibularhizoctonia sp. CBS 109695]
MPITIANTSGLFYVPSAKWSPNKFDGDVVHTAANSKFKLEQLFMPEWLTKR